ncbi:MAG: choice-of-anchor Q domain-containing protein [Planctomycetota bacterium]
MLANRRQAGTAASATNGVQFRAEADAQIIADVINNVVIFNEGDGLNYTTRENNSSDQRDIGGLISANNISNNDQNGIELSGRFGVFNILEIGREGNVADTAESRGNTVVDNGLHGITVRRGGNATIVNNNINFNGPDVGSGQFTAIGAPARFTEILGSGIHVVNGDAGGTGPKGLADGTAPGTSGGNLNVQVSLAIEANSLQGNSGMGIDINSRVDSASLGTPGVQATIRDNLITQNLNDGIELSGPIQGTLLGNFVDANTGRGIDIMSFGTSLAVVRPSNIQIGDGLESGRNVVVGNRQEGIYYVSTAERQDQNLLSTDGNSRLADGSVGGAPATILNVDTNTISDNGVDSALTGTGLVMWIGSTGSLTFPGGRPGAYNTYLGLETGLGTVGGVADATETALNLSAGGTASLGTTTDINSRTNARVVSNTFEGNFGDDVRIQPFKSTVDPATTAGDWDLGTPPAYNISSYTSDPLARLNLVMEGNTGNGLDVRNPTDGYTNAEIIFKSRKRPPGPPTPPGPYPTNGMRLRDITRVPARFNDLGSVLIPSHLLEENGAPDAVYDVVDIQRVDVGNGIMELMVTLGPDVYGVYTDPITGASILPFDDGATIHIGGVFGVNGELHTANGVWQVDRVDAVNRTFILQNTAGEDGPAYAFGGEAHVNIDISTFGPQLAPPFQYPGEGPTTFRIAQGYDTAGSEPQNEFRVGDSFNNGPFGDGPINRAGLFTDWGIWTPNPALNGVITNIAPLTGSVFPTYQVTSPNHGLTDRRLIEISGVNGLPSLNSVFRIEVIDADTFELQALANGQYVDGGEWKTRDESFPLPLAPTFPVGELNEVDPDPRANTPGVVGVTFTEPVTGIDTDDLYLTRDGVRVDLASVVVGQVGPAEYTIDLGAAAAAEGQYELIIDNTFPEATIVPVSPDPASGPAGVVAVNFSEDVTGVDIFDFVLTRDDGQSAAIDLSEIGANLAVTQISPSQYTIDLTSVTDEVGTYRLTLLARRTGNNAVALDGISVGGGAVTINSQGHGLSTGQSVTLDGVIGLSQGQGTIVNSTYRIVVVDNDNFQLFDDSLTAPIVPDDTSYFTTGTWSFDPGIIDRVGRPFEVDRFNVLADATDVWVRANTAPEADIIDVSPDPRNSGVSSVFVQFTEPVRITQVNSSDFVLTRDVGFGPVSVPLDPAINAPIALDDPSGTGFASRFELPNLTALTLDDGLYRLTLRTTDSSRITDRQGSFLVFPAIDEWTVTTSGPAPSIASVFPDPRMNGAGIVNIVFNEAIGGVDTGDAGTHFTLTRDIGDGNGPQIVPLIDPGNGNAPIPVTVVSSSSLEVDLTPVTTDGMGNSIDGRYQLTLNRGSGIFATSDSESLAVDATDSWVQDGTAPNGTILDIDPDPRVADAGVVTVVFSEPVTGVDRLNAATDFTLTRDIGDGNGPQPVSMAGLRVRPLNPVDFNGNAIADPFDLSATVFTDTYVIDLSGPITDTFGTYVLTLTDLGAITDRTGNSFVATVDSVDSWKRLRKTVNDRVIDSIFPGNPIPPYGGQATSSFELPNPVVNDASESFFVDATPPEVVPGSANVQPDPRSTAAGLVTIEFTEPVTGFNLTDLVLTRDANDGNGPQPVSLSGLTLNQVSQSEYTIDLNLKTGAPGTYSLSIQGAASLIQDLAGNDIQQGLILLDTWVVENTGPSATITVTPEFRNIATDGDPILVTFSKDVEVDQVDVGDFRLERNDGSGFVDVTATLAGSTSTLDGAIDASQTTITVANGTVFPAAGGFRVQIGTELLNVTSVNGNVLTVVRGVEGSTAATHSDSAAVTLPAAEITPEGASTLVGNITSGTTTITVVDGSVFPSSGSFEAVIGSEVVTVTGVVGNTLTIMRGSNATSHTNGESVSLTFDDAFSLDLSATGLIDVVEATYRLTLVATNSAIVDQSDIELSADVSAVWQLDRTTPTANVVDVLPDPIQLSLTRPSAGVVNILFNEPVQNVDISDFELYRDGVLDAGLGALSVTPEPPAPGLPARRYTIDLSTLTDTVGSYELRVLAGGIQDLAGNDLPTPDPVEFRDDEGRVLTLVGPTAGVAAADQWEAGPDATPPTLVSVVDSSGQTIPATVFNSVGVLRVTFSEEVTGFDVDDVTLTLNGSAVTVPAGAVTKLLGSDASYLLDLADITIDPGSYVLQIRNDGSVQSVEDLNGNVLADDTDILTPAGIAAEVRWEFQIGEPNASIEPVSPDPRLRPAGVVTVNFSDEVEGVDINDFRLTRIPQGGTTALPVSLQSVDVVMSAQGPDQYQLDLTSVSGAPGTYRLTLVSEGSEIRSLNSMTPLRTDATESWTAFDVIDLTAGQTTPAIDVTFNDGADAVPGDERVDTNVSTADGEQRSLRAAVQTANRLTGDDTVLLATGTYSLTIGGPATENAAASGDLDITDTTGALTIRGQGVGETIIDAGGLFRVFHVLDGATLVLEDLTISGGFVSGSDDGAGLRNDGGTVTLNNVRITGNHSLDDGGGINNAGTMTIVNSTLDLNTAAASGGAIRNVGRLTVINSTIGGRFDLSDEDNPIDERNQAGLNGGGLLNVGGGTAIVVGSTISGNSAGSSGGGIRNNSVTTSQTSELASDITAGQTTLTVSDASVFPAHEGFVIQIDTEDMLVTAVNGNTLSVTRGFNGTTAATHSALSVVFQVSTLTLFNTTIADNSTDSRGGGLSTAGGLAVVANTLIANNTAVIAGPDVSNVSDPNSMLSAGNNLVLSAADAAGVFVQATDLVGQNPLVAPLADNGGPTLTHAILLGSPAIDAGQAVSDATDQRGIPRVLGNGNTDIGAYEFGGFFVNSTADSIDINPGDGLPLDVFGRATLRAAVMEANALAANGSSTDNAIMLGSQVYDLSLTEIDRTAPTAAFTPVSPDPLAAAPTMMGDPALDPVDSIVVTFSEPVHGAGSVAAPLSLSSFRLTYDDGQGGGMVVTLNTIPGVTVEITSQDETTGETVYTITGLEDTFALDGMYTLELLVNDANSSNSLVDFALTPNALAEETMGSGIAATETFIRGLDVFAPTGTISQVTTPRTTNPGIVTLTFNEQVSGVTAANFSLTYDDGINGPQNVDVSSISPQTISATEIGFDLSSAFEFNGLTDIGDYVLTFDGANVSDTSGNLFGQTLTTSWAVAQDTFAPIPAIDGVTPDPRLGAVGTVTVDFDEDVTGVDLSSAETDFDLWFDEDGRSGPIPEVQIDLSGILVTQISPSQYTLDLSSVTTVDGAYRLEISSDGDIEDLAVPANPLTEDAAAVTLLGRTGIVTVEEFVIGDSLVPVVDPVNLGQTQSTDEIIRTLAGALPTTVGGLDDAFASGMGVNVGAVNQMSNGTGDASLQVAVDGTGEFGTASSLFLTPNAGAVYDPVGPVLPATTTFESLIYFRSGTTGNRQTLGALAGSLSTISGTPLDGVSTFTIGNLSLELTQQLEPLADMTGVQNGSVLTQTLRITNTGAATEDFEFVRYIDGDLAFDGSIADGGGRFVLPTGEEILFETDAGGGGTTATTFLGITGLGGTIPATNRYEIDLFPLLDFDIAAGNALSDTIIGDTDGDGFVDAGNEADVTLGLRNVFSLPAGGMDVYTTHTLFGSGAPSAVNVQTSLTPGFQYNPTAFGDLDVTSGSLTLIGTGSASSTVNGNSIDRIFDVDESASIVIRDAELTGGQVLDERDGGGIRAFGDVELDNARLSDNSAGGEGGGLYVETAATGTVTITESEFDANTADFGGGLFNNSQTAVTISDSDFSNNTAMTDGGGIFNDRTGALSVTGTTLSGNVAGRDGAGIYNNDLSVTTLSDSTLTSNSATVNGGGLFNELAATTTINNSTIAFNQATNGAGLYNDDGTLTVAISAISANVASEDGGGAFVTSNGELNVSNSSFSGNMAGLDGGGIHSDGTTTLDNVQVIDNTAGQNGGGLINTRSLTLQQVAVTQNDAGVDGGGLWNSGVGAVTATGTTISENTANRDGGGVHNSGSASLSFSRSTISDGTAGEKGGGLYQSSLGTVTIVNATVSGNAATDGGGIYSSTSLSFSNSTLSTNTATNNGGGIDNNGGAVSFSSATVVANSAGGVGGGVVNESVFGAFSLKNTIVAGNQINGNPPNSDVDVSGVQFNSIGNNLIGDRGSVTSFVDGANADIIGVAGNEVDPLLGPLQDNGGPTLTHALLFGSPARDAGTNVGVLSTDQRGFARIFDGDGDGLATVDIGAFESGFVVNTFADTIDVLPGDQASADRDGNSSLRAAVMEANALAGDDTILLIPGTYTLTIAGRSEDGALSGDLDISDNLTIIGAGTDQTFINAAELDRVFHVLPGARLDLKNLTILGGNALEGGGLLNQGFVALENVVVRDNTADFGAGILNDLVTTVLGADITTTATNLTVSDASEFPGQGSFDIRIGSEEIRVTAVSGNTYSITRGVNGTTAAAHTAGETVTLVQSMELMNSSLINNAARIQGGGVFNRNELTITGSLLSGNTANSKGGGLYNESSVSAATIIEDTTFDNNVATVAGGGIYNNSSGVAAAGRINISGSTLSNNRAGVRGGAIFNNDTVSLLNATVSGNAANSTGGGIYNTVQLDPADGVTVLSSGAMTLTNVTVVRNSTDGVGGGIVNISGASASLRNTIVASNSAAGSGVDLEGSFNSEGNNFIGQAAQTTGLVNGVLADQVGSAASPFDPVIGPLAANGGPTATHALQAGSPATDAGDNSGGDPVDQRGGRRPTDNTSDIGAFEIQENRISIADIQQLEGPGGSTLFVFSVILEQTTAEPISVDFTTFQGTARSGSDFQPVAGTLFFGAGDLTRTITVEVFGDTTPEDDETFQIILSNAVNGVLTTATATGTILNDDAFVRVDDVNIAEGDSGQSNAVFTVSLSAPLQETATITYSTADDSADEGNDYDAVSGTLVFAPGETSMTVEVPVNGDLIVEPFETFFLNLTSAIGMSGDNLTVLDGQGLGTIQNDDIVISVAADVASVVEGTGGTVSYPFTVSLSQPNAFDVTVDVQTVDGTAIGGLDFTRLSGQTVTIPAGMMSAPLNVAVLSDGTFEGGPGMTESFDVELVAGSVTRGLVANANAVLGGPATGEIEDDEPRPVEYLIQRNAAGDMIVVTVDDGINPPMTTMTMDFNAPLDVPGGSLNDLFIVDFVNGNPIPTGGLFIDGMGQTSSDGLQIQDSSGMLNATDIVYTAFDANSGTVDIDGSVINYTGLEPVTDDLVAANRTFDSTAVTSDHAIDVTDAGGMTVISDNGTVAFESITFRNPSTSLTINAGDGDNTITLNAIDSTFAAAFALNAGDGADSIDASGFNFAAVINGEAGDDVITGSANDDTITGGLGADNVSGGDGADTIFGNDGVSADDDASDTLSGNGGADILDGEGGDDVIDGGLAGDLISGGTGNDQIDGGSGNDTVSAGDGDDNVVGGSGNDDLQGDAGNDTLDGEAGQDMVDGGADNDVVNGGDDADIVLGGSGNDQVSGGDGDDDVQGGTGDDTLDGGAGTNTLDGGDDTDTISVMVTGTQGITLTDSSLTVGGEIVTYTSVEQFILNGSDQANNIDASGYSGDVSIFGGDGNDTLIGGSGNDSIVGEGGNDTVTGGAGSDTLVGGAGKDSLDGGSGNDNVSGQSGADTLIGGTGDDTLDGGDDPDSILGGDGADDASGGAGHDTIAGEFGSDTLAGGDGNDELSGGEDEDLLLGGNGNDNLLGQAGDDKAIGNGGRDTINGGAGEDTALGGAGDDSLIGGQGNDILDGQGSSNDVITLPGTTLDDTFTINRSEALVLLQKTSGTPYSAIIRRSERVEINTLDGNDSVTVGDLTAADGFSTFVIDFGSGDDVLAATANLNTSYTFAASGGLGNDSLFGGEGADILSGDGGADVLHGRGGDDTMSGGLGTDLIIGFAGNDVISGDEDNDTLFGSAGLDMITGNGGDDSIRGNGGFDTIDGGDGDDTLRGDGSGDDIFGGAGRDKIDGGGGNDDIFAGAGNDTVVGGAGEDYVLGGDGNDAISGGDERDRLVGNAGRDLIVGEAGPDRLIGGAHQDLLIGGPGADFLRGNGSSRDTLVGENGGDTPDPGDFFHPADASEVDNAFILDPSVFDMFNF